MFVEESLWIRKMMLRLDLGIDDTALDVGCSTREYQVESQPHIEQNVTGPLRKRGIRVETLDKRPDRWVDHVCDLTTPDFDPLAAVGRRFPLVLCNNLLPHVDNLTPVVENVLSLVAPGGWLVVTTPQAYRRVRDPVDNGFRPSVEMLADTVRSEPSGETLNLIEQTSLRIEQRSYYRTSPFRSSWFLAAGRWIPVPGTIETLRYLLPSLRWRVSCVLLRRRPDAT